MDIQQLLRRTLRIQGVEGLMTITRIQRGTMSIAVIQSAIERIGLTMQCKSMANGSVPIVLQNGETRAGQAMVVGEELVSAEELAALVDDIADGVRRRLHPPILHPVQPPQRQCLDVLRPHQIQFPAVMMCPLQPQVILVEGRRLSQPMKCY